jgi:hypothetical protein
LAGVAMIMEHPGKGKRGAPATPIKAEFGVKGRGVRWGGGFRRRAGEPRASR